MPLRQPIVAVLGHVDHGKCVAPGTLIPLADGRVGTAREIFELYSRGSTARRVSDGWVVSPNEPLELLSFDGKRIAPKRVALLWKLFAPRKMTRLRLASGDQIDATAEHPFLLVDSNLKLVFRRTDQIEPGHFLVVPEKVNTKSSVREVKRQIASKLSSCRDFLVFLDKQAARPLLTGLSRENLQLLKREGLFTTDPYTCMLNLRFRASDFFALAGRLGFKLDTAYDMIRGIKNSRELQRCGHTSGVMSLPKRREDFQQLGYVLGCIAGDGYVREGTLDNSDRDVQRSYQTAVRSSLGLETTIFQVRSGWRIRTSGGKTFERFLVEIVGFPMFEKSETVDMPVTAQICQPIFKGFVAGWLDTDGYVSPVNNSIEITTKSERLARQVAIRLLHVGILAKVSEKRGYFTVRVANRPYLGRFLKNFDPKCRKKWQRVQMCELVSSTSRVFGRTPVPGSVLASFAEKDWNVAIPYFGRYRHYTHLSRPFLEKIANHFGHKSNNFTRRLKNFLGAQLTCTEVVQKESIGNSHDFVYDFTIPGVHNFLAERVLAHNTTLLDKIRGTSVASREPGQITQWIGASLLPSSVIKETCGALLEQFKIKIEVPGVLFIDTPGHETFSNLRRRGGSAADIAVLVIDVSKGVEPQTTESLSILKGRRTPFVVAANKIDLIKGWKSTPDVPFMVSFRQQAPEIQTELDNRIYTMIGALSRLGFRSERFDRITDFTKDVAIIPTCARTGEGVPELLAIVAGLTQVYMHDKLETKAGPALGTVLEVKEEPGLGMTINAIIYDGVLKVNDTIVLGGRERPISTKVRAILVPKPLDEIRDPRDRFLNVDRVSAASGVKIAAPNLDLALAGSALYAVPHGKNVKEYARMIEEEVEKLRIQTDRNGVILKTDTLGSLEAITNSLSNYGIPLRLADVGDVSKRDIAEAEAVWVDDRLLAAVLAFNVKVLPDAEEEAANAGIPLFKAEIIYHLIDDYLRWSEEQRAAGMKAELDSLVRPGSVRVLPGFVFRRSKPAVVGVEVLAGRIRPKYPVMDENGRSIGEIMQIQDKGKDLPEATKGMQIAASIDKGVVGRNLTEGQTLVVDIPERHVKILQSRFASQLTPEEDELVKSLVQLKRRENPIWGL